MKRGDILLIKKDGEKSHRLIGTGELMGKKTRENRSMAHAAILTKVPPLRGSRKEICEVGKEGFKRAQLMVYDVNGDITLQRDDETDSITIKKGNWHLFTYMPKKNEHEISVSPEADNEESKMAADMAANLCNSDYLYNDKEEYGKLATELGFPKGEYNLIGAFSSVFLTRLRKGRMTKRQKGRLKKQLDGLEDIQTKLYCSQFVVYVYALASIIIHETEKEKAGNSEESTNIPFAIDKNIKKISPSELCSYLQNSDDWLEITSNPYNRERSSSHLSESSDDEKCSEPEEAEESCAGPSMSSP